MKLTDRQMSAMRRLWKSENRSECFSPDLAKQLQKKGLVYFGLWDYQSKEWNRVVATLKTVHLTEEGLSLASELFGTGTPA